VDLQVKKLELKKEDFKISLVYIAHKSETAQLILGSLFFAKKSCFDYLLFV
jgi:hypothetical protein